MGARTHGKVLREIRTLPGFEGSTDSARALPHAFRTWRLSHSVFGSLFGTLDSRQLRKTNESDGNRRADIARGEKSGSTLGIGNGGNRSRQARSLTNSPVPA